MVNRRALCNADGEIDKHNFLLLVKEQLKQHMLKQLVNSMAIADPIQSSMLSVLKLILSQTDPSALAPVDTSRGRPQEMSAEVNPIEEASDPRRLTLRCLDGKMPMMEGVGGSAAGQIEQLMDLLRTTILIMQEKEVGRQRERERDRERMEEWMQEVGSELVTNHERMMADMLKKFRGVEAEWKETEQTRQETDGGRLSRHSRVGTVSRGEGGCELHQCKGEVSEAVTGKRDNVETDKCRGHAKTCARSASNSDFTSYETKNVRERDMNRRLGNEAAFTRSASNGRVTVSASIIQHQGRQSITRIKPREQVVGRDCREQSNRQGMKIVEQWLRELDIEEPVRELFRQEKMDVEAILSSSDRDLALVGLQDLGLQDKLRSRADALARSARALPFSK